MKIFDLFASTEHRKIFTPVKKDKERVTGGEFRPDKNLDKSDEK